MGASLRANSPLLRAGKAHLAVIATAGRLSRATQERLFDMGADALVEVPGLGAHAPHAAMPDTFDKAYMFAMTQYKKVVFSDADMINVVSADGLFDKDHGDDRWLGAIGFRDGQTGAYFQTGMMVIKPSGAAFGRIMKEFFSNVPPKGQLYNRGMNGRDGVLLRAVFKGNFKSIDNKYSRNLNPRYTIPPQLVSLHLRGSHKPWYDWRATVADPHGTGKKEFGFPYVEWWRVYERLHYRSAEYRAAKAGGVAPGWGGDLAAAAGATPLTHVWMLRYTGKAYVQPLAAEDERLRDKTLPGLKHIAGAANATCDAACGAEGMACSVDAFGFSGIQRCALLRRVFPECRACELAVYWRPHPGGDYPGVAVEKAKSVCRYNLMRDARSASQCGAAHPDVRRLCPCVPVA
jgi:hypothetical protein